MSIVKHPPANDLAFEQIEAAVKETSRGRWFLEEFARRQRNADTMMVLGAIEALQRSFQLRAPAHGPAPSVQAVAAATPAQHADILALARAIAKAEAEIRALRADGEVGRDYDSASDELDAVIKTTEQATSAILSAAERVQEQAWTMRESAADPTISDHLDACATEIYTACAFQDLTAQRIAKMVEAIRFIDQRLASMMQVAGISEQFMAERAALLKRAETHKAADDVWMSEAHQAEIDETFEFFTPAAAAMEPTMVGAELLNLDEPALSMDELLFEARSGGAPQLPRGVLAEATPASPTASMPLEAQPHAREDATSAAMVEPPARVQKTFRMEIAGLGEPDHDEMLEGLIAEATATVDTGPSALLELDGKPLEHRIKAFR